MLMAGPKTAALFHFVAPVQVALRVWPREAIRCLCQSHSYSDIDDRCCLFGVAGLEGLCRDELMSLPLSVKDATVVEGGVAFSGRVHDCYLANLRLRTASRILMRLGAFKATNFRQLEKKLTEIAWELFLRPGILPEIKVTARQSRLYHGGAVAARFKAGIADRLKQTGVWGAPESSIGPDRVSGAPGSGPASCGSGALRSATEKAA